jgi:hypothetical protein
MPDPVEDLWPPEVGTTTVVPPLAILRRQAVILGERTQNLIEGVVETMPQGDGFRQLFYIVAPSFDYKYLLFEIRHGVIGYPVTAFARGGRDSWQLETQEQFVRWLKEILASEETKRVVGSLLAQVKA